MNSPLLTGLLLSGALSASAEIAVVEFSGTVRSVVGSPSVSAPIGTPLSGTIQVDLAQLPADIAPADVLGIYSYFDRLPGYTFTFTVGETSVRYDSVRASQAGGATPAISLQHGVDLPDLVTFSLNEEGLPFRMVLGLAGNDAPLPLLAGTRFPQDILGGVPGHAVSGFTFIRDDNADRLDAMIDHVSFRVVPEPGTLPLLSVGAVALGLLCRLSAKSPSRSPGP